MIRTKKRKCEICGEFFERKHPNQKYCKAKCKLIARKKQLKRSDIKRRNTNQRKDYMMNYMWEYRHHKYRRSSLSSSNVVRGSDTPSVNINLPDIHHDSKLMANNIL